MSQHSSASICVGLAEACVALCAGAITRAKLFYYGRNESSLRRDRGLCEKRIVALETALRQEYYYREQVDGALREIESRTSQIQLADALRSAP